MSWNYRVIKSEYESSEPVYTVHRVIYKRENDAVPMKHGVQEAAPEGESLDDLRADLHQMLEALDKPVLIERSGKLREEK